MCAGCFRRMMDAYARRCNWPMTSRLAGDKLRAALARALPLRDAAFLRPGRGEGEYPSRKRSNYSFQRPTPFSGKDPERLWPTGGFGRSLFLPLPSNSRHLQASLFPAAVPEGPFCPTLYNHSGHFIKARPRA